MKPTCEARKRALPEGWEECDRVAITWQSGIGCCEACDRHRQARRGQRTVEAERAAAITRPDESLPSAAPPPEALA